MNPENDNQYLFDGEWVDLEQYNVDIGIKGIGNLEYKNWECLK